MGDRQDPPLPDEWKDISIKGIRYTFVSFTDIVEKARQIRLERGDIDAKEFWRVLLSKIKSLEEFKPFQEAIERRRQEASRTDVDLSSLNESGDNWASGNGDKTHYDFLQIDFDWRGGDQ